MNLARFLFQQIAIQAQKNPRLTKIILIVFSLHFILISSLYSQKKHLKKQNANLVVKTITLNKKKQVLQQEKHKTLLTQKKKKKNSPKTFPSKKQTLANTKPLSKKKKRLLDQLKKNLNELKEEKTIALESSLDKKKEINLSYSPRDKQYYQDTLILFLKNMLTLPEEGDVKISLTLSSKGDVKKLSIIKSDSKLNTHYIKSKIPNLRFPKYPQAEEKTFTFVLRGKS